MTFPPATAQFVRLEVLDTTINPLIGEFHMFAVGREVYWAASGRQPRRPDATRSVGETAK